MVIRNLLQEMLKVSASDVFIVAGLPVSYQKSGAQYRLNSGALKPADTEAIVHDIYEMAHRDFAAFERNRNLDDDFSFSLSGLGRFRANVFRQRGSLGAVIRVIPFGLPDPVAFGIPDEVLHLSDFQKGLVLITGPAGSGKTTTLACIIDRLNHMRHGHIITMEDPIEYVHAHKNCIVTQREIPTDIATYSEALKSALREAPDVCLLGEMRDMETIAAAITAAEMSQLLFTTLHTTGAAGTIDRIVDAFPANQQRQIRLQLSMVLQAIVSQQLVPTTDGRVVPAFEIMVVNPAIRNLIREEKTHQIDSIIAANGAAGMRTMDQSLYELCKEGVITAETALRFAIHQESLETRLNSFAEE